MIAAGLREHLVAYFEEHHKLVEATALSLLLDQPQPLVVSRDVVERVGSGSPFVTQEVVQEVLARRTSGAARRAPDRTVATGPDGAPGPRPDFAVVREGFSGPSKAETPISGYTRLFTSRYRQLSPVLRSRPGLENVRSIRDLRPADVVQSVVGLVREVRTTSRHHHTLVTLDDETGSAEVLVPRDSPAARVTFLSDEVVGLKLRWSGGRDRLPAAIAVERPDVPASRRNGRSERPRRALLLSDLHVGSKTFLAGDWAALVEFLGERGPSPELARSVDTVVIAGDLVDGIGVYPRQERDVAIPDVVEQYAELGRRLAELPRRLTIVAVPGNHDAVSPAEPQPALPTALARPLGENVRLLANPSTFSLGGTLVAAYHGRGFDDLIPSIPGASYARPMEVMRRMLQMRHLAPIYGQRTPLAPADRDGLVIDPVPDILVTGHLHTYGVDRYRDVLMVNASAWQGETDYQRMRNIVPHPSQATVVDLQNLGYATVDCTGGEAVVRGPAG
ncbi:MAG TPA: metallophosphoesterase [Thermoplasmata archaeon]|nr:metallophosphoesterase [Thermoplasmata archaeon]